MTPMTPQPHTHDSDPHRACAGCAMERARALEAGEDHDAWATLDEHMDHPGAQMFATLLRACGHEVVAVIPASEDDQRIVDDMLKRRPRNSARRAL